MAKQLAEGYDKKVNGFNGNIYWVGDDKGPKP